MTLKYWYRSLSPDQKRQTAQDLGIAHQSLANVCYGVTRPGYHLARKLGDLTGIPLDVIKP